MSILSIITGHSRLYYYNIPHSKLLNGGRRIIVRIPTAGHVYLTHEKWTMKCHGLIGYL